jgi:hypothetical protein
MPRVVSRPSAPTPPVPSSPVTRAARGVRRTIAKALAGALVITAAALPTTLLPPLALADTAPPDSGLPATVSSDPLPTAQIDSAGVVWSQAVVGNTVYAGGNFTKARPAGAAAGTSEVTRSYLLAYNVTTGVLTSVAPALNAQVLSVVASPDGATLYVAGDFTRVGSTTRNHVAAFSTSNGALTSFNPNTNNGVKAIFATQSTVYLGGSFSSVGGKTRHGSSGVDATTAVPTAFDPIITGGSVRAITGKSDGTRIVLGGAFNSVNGSTPTDRSKPGYGLVLLDPAASTTNQPMPVNSLIRDGSTDGSAAIDTLIANPDGTGFFGGGFSFDKSQGNFEGSFRATWAGALTEMEDCHGDTYSVFPQGAVLYVASHEHYCGNSGGFPQTDPFTFQRATAFSTTAKGVIGRDIYNYYSFEGQQRPQLLNWFPDLTPGGTTTGSKKSQAAWSVSGNADYIVYGGEFPKVNNKAQHGLVRFARTGLAPNADGPRISGSSFAPSVKNFAQGIRVSWPANYDRDNEQLSYELIKNGNTGSPVLTRTVLSTFWRRPNIAYLDTAVTAGQSYSFRIKATDPKGNSVLGDPVNITAGSGPSLSSYDQAALADGPQYYWPYNETSGSTAADIANGENGAIGSGVTKGDPGAVTGAPDKSYRFAGTSTGTVSTTTARPAPQIFSVEAWFKTTSTSGGKIIGFGDKQSGLSTAYDRQLYLGNTGKLSFGVNPNAKKVLTSSASYNNGAWHHAVGTLSPAGQFLYVDGVQVGSDTAKTFNAQVNTGYWRVGGDATSGWAGAGTSAYLAGNIDNPAVYPVALTAAQVSTHYAARTGGGGGGNAAPTAAFSWTTSGRTGSFNGSGSSDTDGTIASYAWKFGDGVTSSSMSPGHMYASAGTYPVTLTVKDNGGSSGTVSHNVTVG